MQTANKKSNIIQLVVTKKNEKKKKAKVQTVAKIVPYSVLIKNIKG